MHPSSPLPPAKPTTTLTDVDTDVVTDVQADPWCPDATVLLADLNDHRHRRGRRHDLAYLLTVLLAAPCTTGFEGLIGAARWAATAPADLLTSLGARRDPQGRVRRPSVRTLGRAAADLPPQHLQSHLDVFTATATLSHQPAAAPTTTGGASGALRGAAMDGKAITGARTATTTAPFLVAVVTHATTTCAPIVLSQRHVGTTTTSTTSTTGTAGKKGEAPTGRELLAGMDLAGTVLTADAGHTYAATAAAVRAAGGHYLFVIKGNQPNLLAFAHKVLSGPDRDSPAPAHRATQGAASPVSGQVAHGRREQRLMRTAAVSAQQLAAARVAFGDAAQVGRLTRRRRQVRVGEQDAGKGVGVWDSKEVIYVVTSLSADQADAGTLLELVRGHWSVEAVHHVRDTSYGEDACRVPPCQSEVRRPTPGR